MIGRPVDRVDCQHTSQDLHEIIGVCLCDLIDELFKVELQEELAGEVIAEHLLVE